MILTHYLRDANAVYRFNLDLASAKHPIHVLLNPKAKKQKKPHVFYRRKEWLKNYTPKTKATSPNFPSDSSLYTD